MELSGLILAFAAGIVGTSVGGVQAFVWCGFVGLAGMGIDAVIGAGAIPFIGSVPFGFWWHPMYAFLGGAMAAGYARKMGYIESGKASVGEALAGVKKPDVLLVGGVAAAIGYVFMNLITGANYLHVLTDGAALPIWIVSLIGKAIFDGGSIFGKVPDDIKAIGGRFGGQGSACWLPQQRMGWQKAVIALGWALVSAFGTYFLYQFPETFGFAWALGFFISASSLIMLLIGWPIPVTHHITITSSYAVMMLVNAAGITADTTSTAAITAAIPLADALIWGLGIGMAAAFVADFLGDCFYVYGDVHVDPPAMAIAVMSFFTMSICVWTGLDTAGIVTPLVLIAICLIVSILHGTPKELPQTS